MARRDSVTDIKVYSNCDNIRLKVNGKECGNPIEKENIYIWQGICLRKGENRIEVSGDKNCRVLSEKCNWILL